MASATKSTRQEKYFYTYSFIYIQEISFAQEIMHVALVLKSCVYLKENIQSLCKCRQEIRIVLPLLFEMFNSDNIDCHISHTSLPYLHSTHNQLNDRFFLGCNVFGNVAANLLFVIYNN